MLYIDCFQLTKACLTAQWIVIRLKLHCKSFWFVLKQVLSESTTRPKWDTAERRLFSEKHGGILQTLEVAVLDSQTTCMTFPNTNVLYDAAF